jgi:hypothetical protein
MLSCCSSSSTSGVSPSSSSSKGIASPNLGHPVKVLMDQLCCPLPQLQLPWLSQRLPQARPIMASVIAAVAKVIGHATAPKRILVAAEVGSLRVVTRSGQLKCQSPVLRKGSVAQIFPYLPLLKWIIPDPAMHFLVPLRKQGPSRS